MMTKVLNTVSLLLICIFTQTLLQASYHPSQVKELVDWLTPNLNEFNEKTEAQKVDIFVHAYQKSCNILAEMTIKEVEIQLRRPWQNSSYTISFPSRSFIVVFLNNFLTRLAYISFMLNELGDKLTKKYYNALYTALNDLMIKCQTNQEVINFIKITLPQRIDAALKS